MGSTCKTRSRSRNILSGETINDVPKKKKGLKRLLLQPTLNCIGVEKMAVSQRVCERRRFHSEVIVQHGVQTISLRNYSLTSRATKTSVTERRVCVCV